MDYLKNKELNSNGDVWSCLGLSQENGSHLCSVSLFLLKEKVRLKKVKRNIALIPSAFSLNKNQTVFFGPTKSRGECGNVGFSIFSRTATTLTPSLPPPPPPPHTDSIWEAFEASEPLMNHS